MYVSLYDNQEAMERSYLALGLLTCVAGFSFLGLFFIWIALQVEDEERAIEEQLLDVGEPTLSYALSIQRDIAAQHFYKKGTLLNLQSDQEDNVDFVDNYVTEDYLWEKKRLAEIYEIPISIIISNSYYLVPTSEDPRFFHFFWEMRQQLALSEELRRRQSLLSCKIPHLSSLGSSCTSLSFPKEPWLERAPTYGVFKVKRGSKSFFWFYTFIGPFSYLRSSILAKKKFTYESA